MSSKFLKPIIVPALSFGILVFTGCTTVTPNTSKDTPLKLEKVKQPNQNNNTSSNTVVKPKSVTPSPDRSVSQRLRDAKIENDVLEDLYKLDKRFDVNARVTAHSFHDVVLLAGQVPDKQMIALATVNVLANPKVHMAHNELKFGAEASYQEIMKDKVIKTSIRKNLLLESDFKDSRVKVVVERGVVYLMGILSKQDTERLLTIVQKTGGIKKIISLVDDLHKVDDHYQDEVSKRISASTGQTLDYDPTKGFKPKNSSVQLYKLEDKYQNYKPQPAEEQKTIEPKPILEESLKKPNPINKAPISKIPMNKKQMNKTP